MSDIGNKTVFANNLDYQMKRRKIDRNKLCADLNFKYSTVSEWLSGRKYPRIDKIELLANYFGILKSDLIEDKSNMPQYIRDRISGLCKEKGVTPEQMTSELQLDLSFLSEFGKHEPVKEETLKLLLKIATYLDTTTMYLRGTMDDREMSRWLSGTEIIGRVELTEYKPRDSRLRRIAAQIDALPEPDRSSLLDQIENLLKFYHQTVLNNQTSERSDA